MTDDFPEGPHGGRARSRALVPALLAALAVLALAAWLWHGMNSLESRSGQVDRQLADLAQREDALAGEDRRVADALSSLTAGHEGVARRVDSLYGARRAGLLAAEAEHLVRLAAQRLALMQDPAGALALLDAADAALREIRGADVHASRAAVARDSALLREAASLDIEAAWLRLAALPDTVDEFAARRAAPAGARNAATTAAPAADTSLSGWARFRHAVLALVSIRRVDEPLAPAITASERELAAQNFRLLLEQAQLALLQRRAGIYRHALEQAGRWVDRIAAGDPARRAQVRQELASLAAIDVGPRLPDLTLSLDATRALAVRLLPEGDAAPTAAGAAP